MHAPRGSGACRTGGGTLAAAWRQDTRGIFRVTEGPGCEAFQAEMATCLVFRCMLLVLRFLLSGVLHMVPLMLLVLLLLMVLARCQLLRQSLLPRPDTMCAAQDPRARAAGHAGANDGVVRPGPSTVVSRLSRIPHQGVRVRRSSTSRSPGRKAGPF